MNALTVSSAMPSCDGWLVRRITEIDERIELERGVLKAPRHTTDDGYMVVIRDRGASGYAGTADGSPSGLAEAGRRALQWAHLAARHASFSLPEPASPRTESARSRCRIDPKEVPLAERLDTLRGATAPFDCAELLTWSATVLIRRTDTQILTSEGSRLENQIHRLLPMMVAFKDGPGGAVMRSFGRENGRQAGWEWMEDSGFTSVATSLLEDLDALVKAPLCPTGDLDVVLDSSQMTLQIHESIGHPLEIDRILGDERNFAGTTFVKPEMIGSYQYGSELLNVTFDPDVPGEFASYAFDDDGTPAKRRHLIENGVLVAALGGALSQHRSGLPGVACARTVNWRRPTIDRMANLNIEPGTSTLEELIEGIEHGVYMEANRSWSIDDSRDKFQFGCEMGHRIENGELKEVVRNPNYRGRSASFWRSLDGVGATRGIHGTPFCGKGEPQQIISVGHASPPCRFRAVSVFGSAS